MSRRKWCSLIAAALLFCLAPSAVALAQNRSAAREDALVKLEDEWKSVSFEVLKANALAEELKEEDRVLSAEQPGAESTDTRFFRAPEKIWLNAFPGSLARQRDEDHVLDELSRVQRDADKDQKEANRAWRYAWNRMFTLREKEAETERIIGWKMGLKPSERAIPPGMIGLGVMAILGGLVLLIHENRDRLRWRLRALGSRPSMIVVAIALPLAAACAGWAKPDGGEIGAPGPTVGTALGIPALVKELEGELDSLKRQLAEKQQANDDARGRLDDRLQETRHARAAFSLKPEEAQKKIVDEAEELEAKVQNTYRDIRVAARATAKLLSEADEIENKGLSGEQSKLEEFVLLSKGDAITTSLLRGGTAILFVVAAVVPFSLVRRRRRLEREEQARKCPRCLNKDTLDFVAPSSDREFDEGHTMFRLKVCNVDYCNYEIRENYVSESRLCFPTVGIRSSGKTHWLLMLYDQIKNSNIPVASAIRKIPSREDKQFDEMVQRILYAGGRLTATVYGLPHPLTFHVNDQDSLGANKSMVNLFDYSGEMRNFDIDTDEFRRRALMCEGFTLFLDPTQASEGASGLIASQIDCLSKFAEEMHAIRSLSADVAIDLPIAICVSKIDLLTTRSSMNTQALPLVTALRQSMTRPVDLSLIHERSQLCAAVIGQLFPGWNVERSLRENFGGRYMFFPMSAVGLEEAELGVEDLSKRTIAPCGIIEPLLWLLHMHGYCVFH